MTPDEIQFFMNRADAVVVILLFFLFFLVAFFIGKFIWSIFGNLI